MKIRKSDFYLYVWEKLGQEILNYGCSGAFSSFAAAMRHFEYLCTLHEDKLLKGEIRCEIG